MRLLKLKCETFQETKHIEVIKASAVMVKLFYFDSLSLCHKNTIIL